MISKKRKGRYKIGGGGGRGIMTVGYPKFIDSVYCIDSMFLYLDR